MLFSFVEDMTEASWLKFSRLLKTFENMFSLMFSVKTNIRKDERRTPLRKFSFDFMGLLYYENLKVKSLKQIFKNV